MTAGQSTPPAGVDGPAPTRDPRRPFARSAFSRLARAHALGIAGDALFAIALAGSVFFSLDFDDARWKVALYLLLTIAPFAVAAPLIGPALDRIKGGRRWVIIASMALRAVLCFFVIRHLDSVLFYPEAFLMLVLGKTYSISKSAVVPTTVRSDTELVEANSKLSVISALAVVVAAIPAGILLKLGGPEWTLGLGVIVFGAATVAAFGLAPSTVATEPPNEAERMELRSAAIFLASTAMGMIRAVVGFLAFMLAFAFKNADAPLWQLGLVAASAQVGFFGGAIAAPWLRRRADEERILSGALVVIAAAGLICAGLGGLAGAAVLSFVVGLTASSAKQAFDAVVQRDAPDANRGRSFARFETRFQLFWVGGALVPIVIPLPAPAGFVVVAVVAGFSAGNYMLGLWRMHHGHVSPRRAGLRLGRRQRPPEPPPDVWGESDAESDADRDTEPDLGSQVASSADASDRTMVGGDDSPTVVAAGPTSVPPRVAPTGASPTPASSRPAPTDVGARRWARPDATTWEPPPGFVSQRLGDAVQPPLPLGEPEAADEEDETDYPEPMWRDTAAE